MDKKLVRLRQIKTMTRLRRRAEALGITISALRREDMIVASIKKGRSRLARRVGHRK